MDILPLFLLALNDLPIGLMYDLFKLRLAAMHTLFAFDGPRYDCSLTSLCIHVWRILSDLTHMPAQKLIGTGMASDCATSHYSVPWAANSILESTNDRWWGCFEGLHNLFE